ncbi:MAG: hypothetical protein DCC58_19020 [Chloroflexi bacterium]|nr:MAG: hypothetical protein DCC58_19020 [Chloroflexota bacterium]
MATPARLVPLREQFEFCWDRLINRLDGMSDDEYFWEPAPGCWSIRRRDATPTPHGLGGGAWVWEYVSRHPDPAPFTTIAWRIGHLASTIFLRADYTVGSKSLTWDDYAYPHTAEQGIAALVDAGVAWFRVLRTADDALLDTVGGSSFPWGRDPDLPLLDICWWVNQEALHHGGEIALLRDLYRARRV